MKILFVSIAFLLSGCGTFLGIDQNQIDTPNKRLGVAAAEIESLYRLTTNLLDADLIDVNQATLIKTNLDSALEAVRSATIALNNQDASEVETALVISQRVLEITTNLITNFTSTENKEPILWTSHMLSQPL